jgi:hypothetical protein
MRYWQTETVAGKPNGSPLFGTQVRNGRHSWFESQEPPPTPHGQATEQNSIEPFGAVWQPSDTHTSTPVPIPKASPRLSLHEWSGRQSADSLQSPPP